MSWLDKLFGRFRRKPEAPVAPQKPQKPQEPAPAAKPVAKVKAPPKVKPAVPARTRSAAPMPDTGVLLDLLRAPVITEKSQRLARRGQYVFRVATHAAKPAIRKAVEVAFNVRVASVRVSTMHGKTRSFRNQPGRRADWKKAYVRLQAGQSIELGETG